MSSLVSKKNISLIVVALFVGLALGILLGWLWSKNLGSIRLDPDSNTVVRMFTMLGGNHIYRVKFRDPASFQDYVFVFDPSEVHFDTYGVNYARRDGARGGGTRTDKGAPFPDDASKRMISLTGSANAPTRGYTQPRSSRARNFVSAITAQFFYTRGDRSEEEHEEALAKFRALGTNGQFMVMRGGRYIPLAISSRPYR
jgi:hypothetical protein